MNKPDEEPRTITLRELTAEELAQQKREKRRLKHLLSMMDPKLRPVDPNWEIGVPGGGIHPYLG